MQELLSLMVQFFISQSVQQPPPEGDTFYVSVDADLVKDLDGHKNIAYTGNSELLYVFVGRMTLSSASFVDGGLIPAKHCSTSSNIAGAKNVAPQLTWENAPVETQSFIVLMYEEGSFQMHHWLIYDIPSTVSTVAEGSTSVTDFHANAKPIYPRDMWREDNEAVTDSYIGPRINFPQDGGSFELRTYRIVVFALDSSELGPLLVSDESVLAQSALGHAILECIYSPVSGIVTYNNKTFTVLDMATITGVINQ